MSSRTSVGLDSCVKVPGSDGLAPSMDETEPLVSLNAVSTKTTERRIVGISLPYLIAVISDCLMLSLRTNSDYAGFSPGL